ncbi:MAG: hypothetical protein JRE43_02510, partial [Deltaproteobacteria bacterium]|nr:hypothetical protein [Deltaproteobacteria bacterium]
MSKAVRHLRLAIQQRRILQTAAAILLSGGIIVGSATAQTLALIPDRVIDGRT